MVGNDLERSRTRWMPTVCGVLAVARNCPGTSTSRSSTSPSTRSNRFTTAIRPG